MISNLSEVEREMLAHALTLLQDAVLNGPNEYSDEEWCAMRRLLEEVQADD